MKKVEAVIREERVPMVLAALEDLGYGGVTISSVKGHGQQRGVRQFYRGSEVRIDFLPKVKVELIVWEQMVSRIVKTIAEHAQTGQVGDGKIWVTGVESVLRIRTGETDAAAV